MQESSGKAAELEIAADQAEVFRRRTAHYDYRSLASVLDPIGPQAVADAQQGLARVLGKLQQTWDPPATPLMPLPLDVQEPLKTERLSGLRLFGTG